VITERQIVNLPVNGREFINFALLAVRDYWRHDVQAARM